MRGYIDPTTANSTSPKFFKILEFLRPQKMDIDVDNTSLYKRSGLKGERSLEDLVCISAVVFWYPHDPVPIYKYRCSRSCSLQLDRRRSMIPNQQLSKFEMFHFSKIISYKCIVIRTVNNYITANPHLIDHCSGSCYTNLMVTLLEQVEKEISAVWMRLHAMRLGAWSGDKLSTFYLFMLYRSLICSWVLL